MTPAASSWLTPSGTDTTRSARTATNSACAPIAMPVVPATTLPGATPVTSAPTASTTPEKLPPNTGMRGSRTPNMSGATPPNPRGNRRPRMRESAEFTLAATTRTSTSLGLGVGIGRSSMRSTSGPPKVSCTAARIALTLRV